MNDPILSKLLDDGLAVMAPNDPAKPQLSACLRLTADSPAQTYSLSFYFYRDTPGREAYGSGSTPDEALESFRAKYVPPLTKEGQIAALKAKIAELEGGAK